MKEKRPFIQGMEWKCGACWSERQILQPLEAECSCGYKRPEWCIPLKEAVAHAVKAAISNSFEFQDGCFLCGQEHHCGPLKICTNCGKETCWGWEVDVLGPVNSEGFDPKNFYFDGRKLVAK